MSRKLLIALATCAYGCTCAVAQSKPMRPGPITQQQALTAASPAIVPLSPEQMPASPPQVAFSNGILTIVADNSTLGDVLRAVHHQTGAVMEVPGNATERVVGKFGPGAPRDVLSSLLNGSHFNYVLLGSATNVNALDRVILTSRPAGGEEAQTQQQQQANVGMAGTSTPPMPASAMNAPQPGENADFNDDSGEVLQQPVDGTGDDQTDQAQTDDQQPQPTQPFAPGGGVKTPEQLLQELQQRQQQLQQQQQQGQPFPNPMGGVPPQPQPPQ